MRLRANKYGAIFVGQQTCDQCGASMLYSRRAETPKEQARVKAKR